MMEDSVLGKMLNRLNVMEPQQVYAVLQENGREFRMSHLLHRCRKRQVGC